MKKIAVILFNLGGPASEKEVKPFLFNLFNDPAIIGVPNPFRYFLAWLISSRREKTAQEIYSYLGGKSPILELTLEQSKKLSEKLKQDDKKNKYDVHVVMRYSPPRADFIAKKINEDIYDEILLLPLYPQFSTTTSESSYKEFMGFLTDKNKDKTKFICCYPMEKDFINSHIGILKEKIKILENIENTRFLFSAHGLPEYIVKNGDPYAWQVEETVKKIIKKLPEIEDFKICFQSKVGPLKWLEPATEDEIIRAGEEEKDLVIIPIAFVSEHSETLVELDIEYKEIADKNNVGNYYRVPALGIEKKFIKSLAETCLKVVNSINHRKIRPDSGKKICPKSFVKCLAEE